MKPIPAEQLAFVALLRAAERVAQEAALLLRPHRVTAAQYNVLRILRGARPQGLQCGQISARMINREPDMTRLLDRLAARGWVERERLEQDRRTVRVTITAAGLAVLEPLDEPMLALHRRQFQRLGKNQLQLLIGALELVGAQKAEEA